MPRASITIPLDPEAAKAYHLTPRQEKKKIQAVLSLWLRELVTTESSTLKEIMDEAGRKARAQGLTPEILKSLLKGA